MMTLFAIALTVGCSRTADCPQAVESPPSLEPDSVKTIALSIQLPPDQPQLFDIASIIKEDAQVFFKSIGLKYVETSAIKTDAILHVDMHGEGRWGGVDRDRVVHERDQLKGTVTFVVHGKEFLRKPFFGSYNKAV